MVNTTVDSYKCYQIIKQILWNREIPKECKPTIYKVHIKCILTLKEKLHGFSQQANYTDRATGTCQQS
jgi:hypothetical protein